MNERGRSTIFLALVALVAGCVGMLHTDSPLPQRNTLVFDQLVVYSDFPMPQQHRLLDDLRLQRGDLLAKLELPSSDEPIHVYLFENEASFDRYLREHFPQFPVRRAFFVESDTRLAVYAQWGDRVAEDLRHEVAHGHLHSVVRRVPLWLDEGLAEYFEVPRGSSGLNRPHVELLVNKLMSEGWRPNLERLESLTAIDSMTQDEYAESWAWTHLMLEGPLAEQRPLQEYLSSLRASGTAESLSVALRRLHPHPEQLLAEHLYSLREPR